MPLWVQVPPVPGPMMLSAVPNLLPMMFSMLRNWPASGTLPEIVPFTPSMVPVPDTVTVVAACEEKSTVSKPAPPSRVPLRVPPVANTKLSLRVPPVTWRMFLKLKSVVAVWPTPLSGEVNVQFVLRFGPMMLFFPPPPSMETSTVTLESMMKVVSSLLPRSTTEAMFAASSA